MAASETEQNAIIAVKSLREWIEMSSDDVKMRDCTLAAAAVLSGTPKGKAVLGRLKMHSLTVTGLTRDDPDRVAFRVRVLREIAKASTMIQDLNGEIQ